MTDDAPASRHATEQRPDAPRSDDPRSDGEDDRAPNLLERAMAVLGALAVLALAGYFVADLAGGGAEPAALALRLGAPEARGAQVYVPLEVENGGGTTAVAAVVEVCAGPEACAEVTFDYVPHGAAVRAHAGFRAPLAAAPEGRVVSYREP